MVAVVRGVYYDPLHGGCLRRVVTTGRRTLRVHGVYGVDEDRTGRPWRARMTLLDPKGPSTGLELCVDFSGKPGKVPRFQRAVYRQRRLHWDDGNVWVQLYVHPPSQFRSNSWAP